MFNLEQISRIHDQLGKRATQLQYLQALKAIGQTRVRQSHIFRVPGLARHGLPVALQTTRIEAGIGSWRHRRVGALPKSLVVKGRGQERLDELFIAKRHHRID